jgi:hypothetical protein
MELLFNDGLIIAVFGAAMATLGHTRGGRGH